MKAPLFLSASPMGATARGHTLAIEALENLRRHHPSLKVTARDLSQGGFGQITADYAEAILSHADHADPAFTASEILIRELEETDALVIATPMHNYTVPVALKLWIDLVLRAGRSFGFRDGRKVGLLADRPTLILVSSGGLVRGVAASQPDHLSGYLTDVLKTIGICDLSFVFLEALARSDRAEQAIAQGRQEIAADERFGSGPTAEVALLDKVVLPICCRT
ncbi:FMN-dependent NADH-azoreductase [Falsirhodobacter sp. 20TX0035]|uniref:FMN-dependent NADH-azoreductase n=1 Tax=Falsirhodobacter sp. 20TX0035 TaxID=3022019 RepID=UPI002330F60B|nr:NAD(P)H-dependent oxidoreductase [Falsirhodobacter sp. 20TX0035]MDB6454946.1 NAD(P)H-dependent oxidoreductase [Falsirhodobacter sp. 20TX0035]